MKYTPYLLFILCLVFYEGKCQVFSLKVYQNTDLVKVRRSAWSDQQQRYIPSEKYEVSFNRISIAVMKRTPKWFQEIELSYSTNKAPISWEPRPERPGYFSNKLKYLSIHYELGKRVKSMHKKMDFLIAAGITPYRLEFEKRPIVQNVYPSVQRYLGCTLSTNVHALYPLSQKLFVELNLKIGVFDFRQEQTRIENPAIPFRQQTSERFNYSFLQPAYTVRCGVGYRI
jgi:hypothetical protein